ncbi:MAG: beta-N-acetylhexosaminidase, partial [Chloroflexota bacterium]
MKMKLNQDQWVESTLNGLTLGQKVGQIMMAGFPGTELGPEIKRLIEECHVTGVCLFGTNVQDPPQVRELTQSLQELAARQGDPPLLLAIDQEGGIVTRLKWPFAVFPGNMALGAAGSEDGAHRAASVLAKEMKAVGLNVDFAPVLDVNDNPTNPVIGIRSFGADPEAVTRLGTAMVRGFQDNGLAACAKHFPGHGDTELDSHLSLPRVPHDWPRLQAVELLPFRGAIAAGVASIMTAHVTFPAVEDLPATLSKKVLTGLLRQRLGFQGVIFTDALDMKAIADNFGDQEAAMMAIQAGADVLLPLGSLEHQLIVYQALIKAVEDGLITESRLEASLRRVLAMKYRYALPAASFQELARFPEEAHLEIARSTAQASITLVRDDRGLVPLRLDGGMTLALIEFTQVRFSLVEEMKTSELLTKEIRRRHWLVRLVSLGSPPPPDQAARARQVAGESDV